jgi:hypothetical protein
LISAGAVAVVAAGVGPAVAQAAVGPSVTIGVGSAFPKAYGYTFVVFGSTYDHQKYATATISGSVSNATSGNVAQLYAQPFPYKHAPVAVAGKQVVLNGDSSETYSFTAIPGIATRYSVEILTSTAVSTPPLTTSGVVTSYVVTDQWYTGVKTCNRTGNRPICHQSIQIHTLLPASARLAEARKKLYFYFAINLNPRRIPKLPVRLTLDNSARIGKAKRVSATEFEQSAGFSFRVNNDAYNFNVDFCSKASESSDGVNLPGHHFCGAKRINANWFLG